MDVKEEVEESTTEEVVKEESAESTDAVESDDVDLFGGQEKDIPYSRFKEVNFKKKEAERELRDMKDNLDRKVQDEVYRKELEIRREYESRVAAQASANDYSYDDYESGASSESQDVVALKAQVEDLKKTVGNATSQLERDRLKSELKVLKTEYPALQEEHVMAIAKIRPKWSWEECAEYSHKKMSTHLNNQFKQMVEQKKVAAKSKVVGAEGLRNMKPEAKPKSWAEAGKRAAQFLGGED